MYGGEFMPENEEEISPWLRSMIINIDKYLSGAKVIFDMES